jgi:hypothetical protein
LLFLFPDALSCLQAAVGFNIIAPYNAAFARIEAYRAPARQTIG